MAGGAPTKYKTEYNEQVEKLCRLGATDKEIADFFNVCEATVNNWKNAAPEFLESIKRGKIEADIAVADSLYKRARGYSYTERTIEDGIETKVVHKEQAPDTTAIMAWLNNRRPQNYRSKQYMETVNTNLNHEMSETEADEILKRFGVNEN